MSRVNQRELSGILGVSTVSLLEWQKAGMPMYSREQQGQANEYDTELVIQWMIDRAINRAKVETPRDRLDNVRVINETLNLKVRLGEVVEIDSVQPALDEFFGDVTSELDGMPNRYIDDMHAAKDRTDQYQLLRRIAREIRERLSGFNFRASLGHEVSEEIEAAD